MEGELTSQAGSVDGDVFTERIDVERMVDGTRLPERGEIGVRPLGHQNEEIQRLIDENTALRDRVAELEHALGQVR